MKKNTSNNSGRTSSLILKIFGTILLLALVFAVAFMVLNSLRESYYPESGTSRTESAVEEVEDPETQDTEEETQEEEAAAEESEEALPEETTEEETENPVQETQPQAEDGSGEAGLRFMDETVAALTPDNGWYRDELNAWYSPDGVRICYNGWVTIGEQRFHFDTAGMVDRGWKTIGGESYYFDESGVYQPDAVQE